MGPLHAVETRVDLAPQLDHLAPQSRHLAAQFANVAVDPGEPIVDFLGQISESIAGLLLSPSSSP